MIEDGAVECVIGLHRPGDTGHSGPGALHRTQFDGAFRMITAVFFDVGETIVDESRMYGTEAVAEATRRSFATDRFLVWSAGSTQPTGGRRLWETREGDDLPVTDDGPNDL
jgi:hypothetical protein